MRGDLSSEREERGHDREILPFDETDEAEQFYTRLEAKLQF